jgi:indolepyruvate ferredoxin oxidoreductase beta subunit
MHHDVTTVLICGVGGQGTILAGDILAKTALASGMDVKLSEIHGMSQRGGSVNTIVRFGGKVLSPVTDLGQADCVLAFEATEALRHAPYLAEAGRLLASTESISPLTVQSGDEQMPPDTLEFLKGIGADLIDAKRLALAAGSPRSTNMVLLGALSNTLPFDNAAWEEVIKNRVPPQTVEANLTALHLGAAHSFT